MSNEIEAVIKKSLQLNELVKAKLLHRPSCEKYKIGEVLEEKVKRELWNEDLRMT